MQENNQIIILFLKETLDIEIQYNNVNSKGKYMISAEKSKTEELEISFNSPSAGGEYIFTVEVRIQITESKYRGDYDSPPDPDDIHYENDLISALYISDEGECVEFEIDNLLKNKLMEKFNEVIEVE